MDLRQLAALVAVADHGGFSAAADALHTVQSNVSAHVAKLERELGATLVDRFAGRLTDEGELVVARARRVAAELESLRADVAAVHDVVTGSVRVGTIGTTARWLVPRLLAEAGRRHPGVHLVVTEGTTTTLEPQLAGGALDLAVVTLPVAGREVAAEALFEEDLVLVVPDDHPLAERRLVGLRELDGLDVLLPPPGTAFRDDLDRALAAEGAAITARAELDGLRLIASLAFERHGPAILPATAVPPWLTGGWRVIAVRGLPRRRIGVARRRRHRPSAPARAIVGLLREAVATPGELPPGLHPPAFDGEPGFGDPDD